MITQRAADRGRENVRQGVHAITSAQAPLADMGYDNSRRFVETTASVTEVYRDATESTAEDVMSLVGAYSNIGRGMQRYQHALFDEMKTYLQAYAAAAKGGRAVAAKAMVAKYPAYKLAQQLE